jgi:crossover junction endodeoxyribonuclease RusA
MVKETIESIGLTLPFPPSVNRLWRFGKGRMYRSKTYEVWRKEALWECRIQAQNKQISGAYRLTLLAVKPDKRRRDIGNLEKSVSDILQEAGIIVDDCLCEWIEARWVKDGPPLTIKIESIK